MTLDLIAGTDAGSFILCDVAVARSLKKATTSKLKPHIAAGDVLHYSFGGDGDIQMRLLLDESISESFQPKVCEHQRDLLLRIPTGRLLLCGLECTGVETEKLLAHRLAAASCTADVPPGDYLAEAYELDWSEEPDALAAQEGAELIQGRVPRSRQVLTQVMGYAAILSFFGTPVALFIAYRLGGWMACGKALGVVAILYLLFCVVAWLMKRDPSQKAYDDAGRRRDEILRRFPKVVVQLQRVPKGTDLTKLCGGKFGAGFR